MFLKLFLGFRILRSAAMARVFSTSLILVAGILMFGAFAYAQSTPSYVLGAEDLVTVTVINHPEFSGDFFVPSDGVLNLPGVGKIPAGGKTIDEFTASVKDGLSRRLKKPDVTISLKTPREQRVYVVGAVFRAGYYDAKPGWRITEALAAAGGLASGINAEDCKVIILRVLTGNKDTIDLNDVLRGASSVNLPVNSGDVVTIDAGETIPVYVTGKVKTPGLYRVRTASPGVLNAITMAGGLLPESATSNVQITHLDETSETTNISPAVLDGKGFTDLKLRAGDMLVVPESTARIAVLGWVKQPGFYTLRDGMKVTLSDALGMAQGADNKRAGLASIAVIRTVDGKQQRMAFNMKNFLKNGDAKNNPEILPGDVVYVPETGKLDWDMLVRSISSMGVLLNARVF